MTKTSLAAYRSIESELPHLERLVLSEIKKWGSVGATSDDIRNSVGQDMAYSSITARYASLARKGLITFNGTRPGDSGRNQRVMVASENAY